MPSRATVLARLYFVANVASLARRPPLLTCTCWDLEVKHHLSVFLVVVEGSSGTPRDVAGCTCWVGLDVGAAHATSFGCACRSIDPLTAEQIVNAWRPTLTGLPESSSSLPPYWPGPVRGSRTAGAEGTAVDVAKGGLDQVPGLGAGGMPNPGEFAVLAVGECHLLSETVSSGSEGPGAGLVSADRIRVESSTSCLGSAALVLGGKFFQEVEEGARVRAHLVTVGRSTVPFLSGRWACSLHSAPG